MFRAGDFKCKEVVNLCDGEKLGFVYDLEIDEETGKIASIIVPGRSKVKMFGSVKGIVIPWEYIKKMGEDIIIVDVEKYW